MYHKTTPSEFRRIIFNHGYH